MRRLYSSSQVGTDDNYISMTKDSDGDGFNNSVDACPLTDIQWTVDETGQ